MAVSRKKRVVFAVVVLLAALAGAVAVYAFLTLAPAAVPPDTPGFYRPGSWAGLRHEHVPGMRGRLNGVSVRINGLGLRGGEIAEEKPAGVARVVIVGDSVVFGQGVEESGTLAVQLEALLRERDPAKKWQVLNAGVRGYNARDYRIWLEHRGLALDPDIIILVITEINDPEREPFAPASAKIERWKKSRWTKVPVLGRLYAGAYAEEVNRLFTAHVREIYDPAGGDWKLFIAELTAIRDFCRARNVTLIAVSFPMLSDDDMFASERAQLAGALSDLGINRLDPRPSFASIPAADLAVSPSDFHPNARALGLASQLLAAPVIAVAAPSSGH